MGMGTARGWEGVVGSGAGAAEQRWLKYTRTHRGEDRRRATHGRTHKESNSGFHGRGGMTESIPRCV